MTKAGERLIKSAKEAVEIARGEREPSNYNLPLGERSVFEKQIWNAAIEAAAMLTYCDEFYDMSGAALADEIRKLKK